MAMPSALIGFAFFKSMSAHLSLPFTPAENVLVQTVAGAVGTMPLGCGFVGVIPALEFLLAKDENGPLRLPYSRLAIWSLGVCLFGVVFAVPLRKQVIIREKLKFPSGTATALMIGVLHGSTEKAKTSPEPSSDPNRATEYTHLTSEADSRSQWKSKIKLLVLAFSGSAVYVGRAADVYSCAKLIENRHFSPISYLNSVRFQFLVCTWHLLGYGH